MKLMRVGARGAERPALFHADGTIRDLSGHVADIAGDALGDEGLDKLRAIAPESLPVIDAATRIGPCVAGVGKFMCIGRNYAEHAAETGSAVPEEPMLFMKATSAISGPNDPIIIPRGAKKTDWEVELAVIIGREGRYIAEDEALAYVAGYCVANDVSERSFQKERGGQFTKGKSADSFGPIGPWLVTRDEVPDPQALDLFCEIDGVMRQSDSTAKMIYGVAHLIHHLSQFMSLHPGDIIATGTPSGVGMGMKPTPVFLGPGQTVRLGVSGLGEQLHITEASD